MDSYCVIISLSEQKRNLFGKYIIDIMPPKPIKLISNIDELEHLNAESAYDQKDKGFSYLF